ncbi:hypothetical protein J6O48_05325 [bacterium]|nr:hypothetical protein [bacterium]
MNVSPVKYNSYVALRSNENINKQGAEKQSAKGILSDITDKFTPLEYGAFNTVLWTGMSYGIDRVFNKLFKMETSRKMSLALSGAIGLFVGVQSYLSARAVNKEKSKMVQES